MAHARRTRRRTTERTCEGCLRGPTGREFISRGERAMKKILVVLAVSSSSASSAFATGIIYDGFEYSATGNPPLGTGPSAVPGAFGRWVYQGNNIVEPRI